MTDELYGHFTRCVELIRNPFRAVNYRDTILPLLFYKIASDTYRDKCDEVEERVGSEVASESDWYEVAIPEGCMWQDVRAAEGSLANSILDGYGRLSTANTDGFGEILPIDADQLRKLEDGRLESLVEHLSSRNLSRKRTTTENLGLTYHHLALRILEYHRSTERSLPPLSMAHLLTSLLGPMEPGSRIHDPTCGVGTLLAKAAHSIRESEADLDLSQFAFSGHDADPNLVRIARMNLYANDVDGQLRRGGRAFAEEGSSERFDFVLSSLMPAAPDVAFRDRDWRPKLDEWTYEGSDLGLARLVHGISRLSEGGRGAFLIPASSLTGSEAGRLREHLTSNDVLEAVIGFPEEYGQDEHERAVLLIDKSSSERYSGGILFVDLDRSFFRCGGSDELELTGEGINRINAIIEGRTEKEGVSCVTETEEVASKGGSLRPVQYVRANQK